MWIENRKVLLKPNPIRDDLEKKALNFKCGEKSRLSLHVIWCADRNLTNLSVFEEASKIFLTAMIESLQDTVEMQDNVDKLKK